MKPLALACLPLACLPLACLPLVWACSSPSAGVVDSDAAAAGTDADLAREDAASPTADGGTDSLPCHLNSFPAMWISGGPDCGIEPDIQVHPLNPDTYVLRQSLCTSFEAPFLYLLFGEDKALLEDTGDGNIDIVSTVEALVAEREAAVGHDIELVVVNSHAHGDHVQGNGAFAQSGATLVGASQAALQSFFSMSWPHQFASYDLGGRIVEVAGIPGHQKDHIALYDTRYGLLLTGDTLYPGRLYIGDFPAFQATTSFLVDATDDREVCAVLGTHIEMTSTPGEDYDFGATHHPDERELLLTRDTLIELDDAVQAMGNVPVRETHDDFIVYPL